MTDLEQLEINMKKLKEMQTRLSFTMKEIRYLMKVG